MMHEEAGFGQERVELERLGAEKGEGIYPFLYYLTIMAAAYLLSFLTSYLPAKPSADCYLIVYCFI